MNCTYFQKGFILARKSSSMETQSIPESTNTQPSLDFNKIVETSKSNIQAEKPKRHRRTKAEIEAARGNSPQNPQSSPQFQNSPQPQVDRSKELKPAIVLYSDLFLARPTGIADLKFTDDEADALAQVTSNLLNAFPEYFNNSNPKVAAIVGAVIVAGPIGFSKYKIYKQATREKKVDETLSKVSQAPEIKRNDEDQQNFAVNGFTI